MTTGPTESKSIQLLNKGDVVQISFGIEHWHRASPNREFTPVAVTVSTPIGGVDWSQSVTEEEYNKYITGAGNG